MQQNSSRDLDTARAKKKGVNTFPKGLSDMTSPRVVPPLISQFLSRLRDDGLINETQRDLN